MTTDKTKRFKWQKIGIVACAIFMLLSITCSAIYSTPNDDDLRLYYSPIRFDFDVLGTVAELTPTILYDDGALLPSTIKESAYYGSSVSDIFRTNLSVSTLTQPTVKDVTYRLRLLLSDSTDNFTIKITAPDGYYDFAKYGIPQLSVPTGYDVSAKVTYHMRFTQSQSYTVELGHYVQYVDTYTENADIPLMKDKINISGESYTPLGNVIIEDYETTLTFTLKKGAGYGDAGYYLWNTVIDYTEQLEEIVSNESYAHLPFIEPVYLYGTNNGVVDTIQVMGIWINEYDGLENSGLEYELAPDSSVLAYDFRTNTWNLATRDEYGMEMDEITPEQMRCLVFTERLEDSIDVATEESAYAVYEFMTSQTQYYQDNPLTEVVDTNGTPYAFTDGDGGMYLHYYVDSVAYIESSYTISSLYDLAYNNGLANGNNDFTGDYTSWIATAVGGVLSVELFPNFTLGGILGTVFALFLVITFLRIYAGG